MYRETDTIISSIEYHYIICPRYRRKIFLINGVEEKFKNIVYKKCKDMDIQVIDLNCYEDFAYLHLDCSPQISPAKIIKEIKLVTSKELINSFSELSKMPNVWTKNFLVSTSKKIPNSIINKFVNSLKKRY